VLILTRSHVSIFEKVYSITYLTQLCFLADRTATRCYAERGYEIVCRLSVRLSVRPSVRL